MLRRIVFATLLLSGPAMAENLNPPNLIRGLCKPDGCDEFSILSNDQVRQTPEGTLKRLHVKTYHSDKNGRVERSDDTSYAFCSTSKPAVIAQRAGQTKAFLLAPFGTSDSKETRRLQTNFFAVYFAACHGLDSGRTAARSPEGAATAQGYQPGITASRTIDLTSPEAIFGASPAVAQVAPPRTLSETPPSNPSGPPLPPRAAPAPVPAQARPVPLPPREIPREAPREIEDDEDDVTPRGLNRPDRPYRAPMPY